MQPLPGREASDQTIPPGAFRWQRERGYQLQMFTRVHLLGGPRVSVVSYSIECIGSHGALRLHRGLNEWPVSGGHPRRSEEMEAPAERPCGPRAAQPSPAGAPRGAPAAGGGALGCAGASDSHRRCHAASQFVHVAD